MDKVVEAIAAQIGLEEPNRAFRKSRMPSHKEMTAHTVLIQQWRDLREAVRQAAEPAMTMPPSESRMHYPGNAPGYVTHFYRSRISEAVVGSYMAIVKTSSIGGRSWTLEDRQRNVSIEVLASDPWAPDEDKVAQVNCKIADLW